MPKPGSLTPAQVALFKKATYRAEVLDDIEDADVLGIMVSNYLQWDGAAVIRAFSSALEDANFHAENKIIREQFKWAFEEETGPQMLGAKNPDWYNRTYGRKPRIPYETIEQREAREQLQKISAKDIFQEETAGEESEMPVLFYQHSPLDPALLSTYVHTPDAPEITLSDIHDVLHCTGRWSRLKSEGYPCMQMHDPPATGEDIVRATQFLLSQGFKPMQ